MEKSIGQAAHFNRFLGRSFIPPLFDYMLIGGGLSLIVVPFSCAAYGTTAVVSRDKLA